MILCGDFSLFFFPSLFFSPFFLLRSRKIIRGKEGHTACVRFSRKMGVSVLSQKNHALAIFNTPPCTFRSDPSRCSQRTMLIITVIFFQNGYPFLSFLPLCLYFSFSFSYSFCSPTPWPSFFIKRKAKSYDLQRSLCRACSCGSYCLCRKGNREYRRSITAKVT